MEQVTDCYSCNGNAEFDRLPPRERIDADSLWRVAHAFGTAVAEAALLGIWQVRLSRVEG
jgi:hypothetical protein